MPKKDRHSVGVAPQYAASPAKMRTARAGVGDAGITRGAGDVGLRLFLLGIWNDDIERMPRARVPLHRRRAPTKPEIAIEEIHRVIAFRARFGCVLADANLPADTSIKALANALKAGGYQQLKDELGFDHFEGRSWTGLHRHALMTMIACTFLQFAASLQQDRKGLETAAATEHAAARQAILPLRGTAINASPLL